MKRIVALMTLVLLAGCTHRKIVSDAAHPEIVITENNHVLWRGEKVDPDRVPELLKDNGYTRRHTITIRVPDEKKRDLRMCYYVMRRLVENGFSRPVLVTEKQARAETTKKKRNQGVKK